MDRTLAHLQRIVLPDPTGPVTSTHAFNLPLINALVGAGQPAWKTGIPPVSNTEAGPDEVSEPASGDIKWLGENLNDSQKEAIRFCLTAEHVACIHGPPGVRRVPNELNMAEIWQTGKTHTLIELIFQLLARPASSETTLPPRILVATPSNLALDNLLLRLHALSLTSPYSTLLPRKSILRLGHPTRVHRDLVKETLDWKAANGEEGELLRDVGKELDGHLGDLGKKRGEKGAVKGKERGKRWEEVRELRKECVKSQMYIAMLTKSDIGSGKAKW